VISQHHRCERARPEPRHLDNPNSVKRSRHRGGPDADPGALRNHHPRRALLRSHRLKGEFPVSQSSPREVILYRMVLPTHTCPYGLLAKRMLDDSGLAYDDRLLTTREQVDAFMAEHKVQTTPQIFIDGEGIGGSEELASYLESATAGG
jgi:glutaredoxin